MKPVWSLALTVAVLASVAVPVSAQPVISAKSGVVSYIEGKVFVGDQELQSSLTSFPEVKEKMVLHTTEGRAEILLTPGVFLRVGENSSFRMITNRLIDTRLELLTGSAVVEADEVAKDTNLTIVAGKASILVAKHGLYRFDMEPARLKVFDGVASVTTGEQVTPVAAGKMLSLDSENASVEKFDKETTDALDRWSKRRAENVAMANVSSAKQVHDYGCTNYSTNFANPVNPVGVPTNSPCYNPCGGWRYNTWYGMVTYIPCGNNIYSPYGYRYWSPVNIARMYYVPPAYNGGGGYGRGAGGGYYPSMGSSSGGYSGAASSAGIGASSGAVGSSGSSGASSAGSSSAGHGGGGAAGGGGHGK